MSVWTRTCEVLAGDVILLHEPTHPFVDCHHLQESAWQILTESGSLQHSLRWRPPCKMSPLQAETL